MPDLVIRTEKTPLDRETLFRGVQPHRRTRSSDSGACAGRYIVEAVGGEALPPDPDEDAGSRRRSNRTARGRVTATSVATGEAEPSGSLLLTYVSIGRWSAGLQ